MSMVVNVSPIDRAKQKQGQTIVYLYKKKAEPYKNIVLCLYRIFANLLAIISDTRKGKMNENRKCETHSQKQGI
jgi:hypothetical protein